jgi:hypothetical protein
MPGVKPISELIEKLTRIFTWFKHSVVGADALKKAQLKDGISEDKTLKLIQCYGY